MSEIRLTPEAVDAYTKILVSPADYGMPFKPIGEILIESDVAIPAHILFKEFIDVIQKPLPKVMFYIIMDNLFAHTRSKAPNGDMGYKLKVA